VEKSGQVEQNLGGEEVNTFDGPPEPKKVKLDTSKAAVYRG
jgi:hypothetical protein